jgi:hypothetical protein
MLIGTGGNTESGRMNLLMASARRCAIAEGLQRANNMYIPPLRAYGSPTNEGAKLQGKIINCSITSNSAEQASNVYFTSCGNMITPAFVPESVRISRLQQETLSGQSRFSDYIRFNPLPACTPLPATATNPGDPVPSFNNCLPNKNARLV